jgi:hypothetical protein
MTERIPSHPFPDGVTQLRQTLPCICSEFVEQLLSGKCIPSLYEIELVQATMFNTQHLETVARNAVLAQMTNKVVGISEKTDPDIATHEIVDPVLANMKTAVSSKFDSREMASQGAICNMMTQDIALMERAHHEMVQQLQVYHQMADLERVRSRIASHMLTTGEMTICEMRSRQEMASWLQMHRDAVALDDI